MRARHCFALAVLFQGGMPFALHGQQRGSTRDYALERTRIELPGGRHVQIRNRGIFVALAGTWSLSVYIETPTPASDVTTVRREATDLANSLPVAAYEAHQGAPLRRMTVLVCRTQACVELREVTEEIFTFVRDASGRWVLDGRTERGGQA